MYWAVLSLLCEGSGVNLNLVYLIKTRRAKTERSVEENKASEASTASSSLTPEEEMAEEDTNSTNYDTSLGPFGRWMHKNLPSAVFANAVGN